MSVIDKICLYTGYANYVIAILIALYFLFRWLLPITANIYIVDITRAYIWFILLHKWNKMDDEAMQRIEESKWHLRNKTTIWFYKKLKKLNSK